MPDLISASSAEQVHRRFRFTSKNAGKCVTRIYRSGFNRNLPADSYPFTKNQSVLIGRMLHVVRADWIKVVPTESSPVRECVCYHARSCS